MSKESVDIGWDAAQAANRAHDKLTSTSEEHERLIFLKSLALPGVTINGEAESAMQKRVDSAETEFKTLLNMAGWVTKAEVNPFTHSSEIDIEAIKQKGIILWVEKPGTEEKVPVVDEAGFKSLAMLANPRLTKSSVSHTYGLIDGRNSAYRNLFSAYKLDMVKDTETSEYITADGFAHESLIMVNEFTSIYQKAEDVTRGNAVDSLGVIQRSGIGPRTLEVMSTVASFINGCPELLT